MTKKLRLRSANEIATRLRQEVVNVRLRASPPRLAPVASTSSRPIGADPKAVAARLKGSKFAAEVVDLGEQICRHSFPLFGLTIETGDDIHWRRDYLGGKETGLGYFRFIPYLDASRAGDHKIVWELNRHQHLVVLAQAFLFTGGERYIREIRAQLESWLAQNPYQRGINWASALEVAFRALSWMWTLDLAGDRLDEAFRERLGEELYRHGRHLANNLSHYFSPNTHLLGEAVALHALGRCFPGFREAKEWERIGARVVRSQMHRQVHDDGSHFEQSSYYHVYTVDMFAFHAMLGNPGPVYLEKLGRMAQYLHALLGPARSLPFLGDDDGGRFFHPYGPRDQFGHGTMAACSALLNRPEWLYSAEDLHPLAAWWFGADVLDREPGRPHWESHLFGDAGIAAMVAGDRQVLVDAGRFGPSGSGHSHSDTLSIVARSGGDEILIDPGTFTYVGDAKVRNWFRGSGAHSSIRIGGRDQAIPAGPFGWKNPPDARVNHWSSNDAEDLFDAECRYAGFTHRRYVRFVKPDVILVLDQIEGPANEYDLEQIWHLGSEAARARLVLVGEPQKMDGWRSRAFGAKEPSTLLCVRKRSVLPARFAAAVLLGENVTVQVELTADGAAFHGPGWTKALPYTLSVEKEVSRG